MGLDQYLHAKKYLSTMSVVSPDGNQLEDAVEAVGLNLSDLDSEYPSATIGVKVGYWRKANHIHGWFVNNVQDGEDNCREYEVSREQLAELRSLCQQVLDNHDLAEELLPVQEGFFFGSDTYDEWYFLQTKYTLDLIDKLLDESSPYNATKGLGAWWFTYDSSW